MRPEELKKKELERQALMAALLTSKMLGKVNLTTGVRVRSNGDNTYTIAIGTPPRFGSIITGVSAVPGFLSQFTVSNLIEENLNDVAQGIIEMYEAEQND